MVAGLYASFRREVLGQCKILVRALSSAHTWCYLRFLCFLAHHLPAAPSPRSLLCSALVWHQWPGLVQWHHCHYQSGKLLAQGKYHVRKLNVQFLNNARRNNNLIARSPSCEHSTWRQEVSLATHPWFFISYVDYSWPRHSKSLRQSRIGFHRSKGLVNSKKQKDLYKDLSFFLSWQSDEHMCNTRRERALARLIRST